MPSRLAAVLRDRRIAQGKKSSEVAEKLEVSRQLYWNWENAVSAPFDCYWSKLAEYLELDSWRDVEALIEPEPPAMPPAGGVE